MKGSQWHLAIGLRTAHQSAESTTDREDTLISHRWLTVSALCLHCLFVIDTNYRPLFFFSFFLLIESSGACFGAAQLHYTLLAHMSAGQSAGNSISL